MKKVLICILVAVLVIGAAVGGFFWYRNTHIFVENAAYAKNSESLDLRGQEISFEHYDSVHAQLPDCEILWDVPFQNGKYASDTQSLSVSALTEKDLHILYNYFPDLGKLDASGCQEYALLEEFSENRPGCEVIYQVSVGTAAFAPDTPELTLEPGDFDYDTLMENLKYLPDLAYVTLRNTELTLEQAEALREAYPEVELRCTVELLGTEYDMETTELDLSAMTSEDVEEVSRKLEMLPNLTNVELSGAEGGSTLTKADVKALQEAAPEVSFHYTFDFFGVAVSTTDEEVVVTSKKIGEEGVEEVRQTLDIMENCSRFVLDRCQISNETMAQLREDYREKTKVVWRVYFGENGSSLTDVEVIRAVYGLDDDNCSDLIYCEDVRFADFGHNEYLDGVPFVAGMTNLEVIIISGAPVKDLTPFENCKKLRVLEAAFCEYIYDAAPLASCESLEMLNISYTHITDLSPLDELELTHLCAKYYPRSRVSTEEQERFVELHPDCWSLFVGEQPYGAGWRYDSENEKLDWYAEICEAFGYPNPMNNTGWYLD